MRSAHCWDAHMLGLYQSLGTAWAWHLRKRQADPYADNSHIAPLLCVTPEFSTDNRGRSTKLAFLLELKQCIACYQEWDYWDKFIQWLEGRLSLRHIAIWCGEVWMQMGSHCQSTSNIQMKYAGILWRSPWSLLQTYALWNYVNARHQQHMYHTVLYRVGM